MIKAVILDFDDTLCMTEAACFELENDVLLRMGRSPMSRDIHLKTWGRPLFEATLDRSPGIDIDEYRRVYEPLIESYVASGKLDSISDVNMSAIDTLITRGFSVLVLTSRVESELKHLLDPQHPLTSRLAGFYHQDNMKFHKPDPRAFAHIEHEHGWKPEECVYVGDSVSDAQSAKGAGLHFIASLESGLRTRQDFEGLPVDAFIETFADVVEAVTLITKE